MGELELFQIHKQKTETITGKQRQQTSNNVILDTVGSSEISDNDTSSLAEGDGDGYATLKT